MPREVTWPRLCTSFLRPLPDFVLIGAMKCGTTTLHHQLREHPNVRAPIRKEIHYFDRHFARGTAWYRAHFPWAPFGRNWQTGEASPYYFCHPKVPGRIVSCRPDIKLILLLRNPVARAYSHYQQIRAKGWEPLSFEDALSAEADRIGPEWAQMESESDYFSESHRRFSYLQRGRYVEQLAFWLRFFRREQFLVLRTEDLRDHPEELHATVQQFLGLRPWKADVTRNHKMAHYQPMNERTRERLTDYFAPYNRSLYDLVGRDFGWESGSSVCGPSTEIGGRRRK